MNSPLKPGEVRVETINISDTGIALIILDGQLAESERYLMTLSRRRARLLAELRELEDQIAGVKQRYERTENQIRNADRAIAESNTFTYDMRRL